MYSYQPMAMMDGRCRVNSRLLRTPALRLVILLALVSLAWRTRTTPATAPSPALFATAFLFGKIRRQRRAERFRQLIQTRRTVNEFGATLPANWKDSLERAVRCATFAPNHKRTEPWRFHLLGPEAIRNVCELNAKIVTEAKSEAAGEAKLKRWLAMPGWLVVTCQKSDGDDNGSMDADPTSLARENYAACCCAVQNLCLSLHAEGLGTKWTTGPVNFHKEFGTAAGLSDAEYVVGTLWFGTPVSQPKAPKKKHLDEVFFQHN